VKLNLEALPESELDRLLSNAVRTGDGDQRRMVFHEMRRRKFNEENNVNVLGFLRGRNVSER